MGSPETSGVSGNRLLYAFACRDTDRLEVRLLMRCMHEIEAGQEEIRRFVTALLFHEECFIHSVMPRTSQASERNCALRDTVAYLVTLPQQELRERYSLYVADIVNPNARMMRHMDIAYMNTN